MKFLANIFILACMFGTYYFCWHHNPLAMAICFAPQVAIMGYSFGKGLES